MPRPLKPETRKTAVGVLRPGGTTLGNEAVSPGRVAIPGRVIRTSSALFMKSPIER